MKARELAIAAVAALALLTTPARAADEIDPSAVRAEHLAEEAHAKVGAAAYADAIELYLAAYKESPAAVLLYDAAYVYDRHLGARSPALEYYRRALAAGDLEERLATRARAHIAELDAPPPSAPPAAVAEAPPSRATGMHPLRIAGAITAGAGVVALGTAGVLGLMAKSKDDEAGTYCTGDRCTDARALSLTDDATSLARGADIAFVAGAVLLAGGVVMWLVAPSRKPPAAAVAW